MQKRKPGKPHKGWKSAARKKHDDGWYCDKCHVVVRQRHCQHCGKQEDEPR